MYKVIIKTPVYYCKKQKTSPLPGVLSYFLAYGGDRCFEAPRVPAKAAWPKSALRILPAIHFERCVTSTLIMRFSFSRLRFLNFSAH